MGFSKVLGWIIVPYIMIFIRWKKHGKANKIFGIPWAIISFIIFISIIANGGSNTSTVSTSAQVNQDTKSTSNEDKDKADAKAKADADAKAKAKADTDAKAKADADAKAKATADEAAKNPKWNTSDIDANKNGNISLAIKMLKANGDMTQNAANASPADVIKTPWNYYGKAISFSGQIGFVQDYPPGSNFEKMGILSQIVIGTDDDTGVDLLLAVPSGSLKQGDNVTIAAVPVGIFDNDNKQGGKTRVLAAVANKVK